MPVQSHQLRTANLWLQQDPNVFHKLDFHLAKLEYKHIEYWSTWNKITGSQKWMPNMGTTLRGVRGEPSPLQVAQFFPNDITIQPRKEVVTQREMSEDAVLKRHLFETPYFSFLPSFQDFRRTQVPEAGRDLSAQITAYNDIFIRTNIFHKSPHAVIAGKGSSSAGDGFDGDEYVYAPSGNGSLDGTGDGKSTAWLQQMIAYLGSTGARSNLSFKLIKKVKMIMAEDLQIYPFEGIYNVSKQNEVVKGKYMIIGGAEAYEMLSFDEFILANKDDKRDLINDVFSGIISKNIVYMTERFPLRISTDGTIPAPQIYVDDSAVYNDGETVPNPAYVNAPIEVAFMCGYQPYKSLAVGPPPSEFASARAAGGMSMKKFAELRWNGEVRLTDNLIVNYGSGNLDTNKYGEYVQFIADLALGIVPCNRRAVIPIFYRRWRPDTV